MLGKRFRRTTSMSHLGPAGCDPASSDESSDSKVVQGMQEYSTVCCHVPHKAAVTQEEGCHDANSGGYADMVLDFDPPYKFSDAIFSESPTCEDDEVQDHERIPSPFQVQTPPLVPYQMGLWTHQHMGFVPQAAGPGKLQHMYVEASISPVDFLDACFYCKRRLKHERDIFIYRGDSAFCSEECRHRQILRDERRSLRGANKRGARASSSETAVAA